MEIHGLHSVARVKEMEMAHFHMHWGTLEQ